MPEGRSNSSEGGILISKYPFPIPVIVASYKAINRCLLKLSLTLCSISGANVVSIYSCIFGPEDIDFIFEKND